MQLVSQLTLSNTIVLDNVTLTDAISPRFRLRRARRRRVLQDVVVSHCLRDFEAVRRWLNVANILFASQGYKRLDDAALALVESYLNLLLSPSGCHDKIQRLSVTVGEIHCTCFYDSLPWYMKAQGNFAAPPRRTMYHFTITVQPGNTNIGTVSITVDHERPDEPYIEVIEYLCPAAMDRTSMVAYFESLETELTDLNGAHTPLLIITCRGRPTLDDVFKLLLDGSIFARYLRELRKVSPRLDDPRTDIWADELLSTPPSFALDDATVSLSTTQRVEWLLRDRYGGARQRYLRGLQDAARVSPTTRVQGSVPNTSASSEAQVGASAQVKEIGE